MKKPSDYKYYPKMIYFKTEKKLPKFTNILNDLKRRTGEEVEDLLISGLNLLNLTYDDKGNKI